MNRKQFFQISKTFSAAVILALTATACNELVNPNIAGKRAGVDGVSGDGGGDGRALAGNSQGLVTGQKHPDFPNSKIVADPKCEIAGSLGNRTGVTYDDGRLVEYSCMRTGAFWIQTPAFGYPDVEASGRSRGSLFGMSEAQAVAILKAETNYDTQRRATGVVHFRNDLDARCLGQKVKEAFTERSLNAVLGAYPDSDLGELRDCLTKPVNKWLDRTIISTQNPFGGVYRYCVRFPNNAFGADSDTNVCLRAMDYVGRGGYEQFKKELRDVAVGEVRKYCQRNGNLSSMNKSIQFRQENDAVTRVYDRIQNEADIVFNCRQLAQQL